MRLIDADVLRTSIEKDRDASDMPKMWYEGIAYAINHIIHAPTADVQEVKHGRWVKQFDENCWWTECSECGNYPLKSAYGDEQLSDFCPYCGADMRKETEDE